MQGRAQESVDAILEATAQILEREAPASTNRIAERAGVSIGTLYQYFPNRDAILNLLAEREQSRVLARIEAALEAADPAMSEQGLRAALRAFLYAFDSRHRLRRHLILTLMPRAPHLLSGAAMDQGLGRIIDRLALVYAGRFRPLGETARFVLTRAVMGVVRHAIVERRDLHDPLLEDELVRLIMACISP